MDDQTNPPAEKTFTQTELNHLLAEEKRAVMDRYSDYEDLKSQVSGIEDAKTTAYEAGKSEATNALTAELIKTEVKGVANAKGFHSIDDALAFFGDLSTVSYDPEKGVDADMINERLTQLATDKPYLVKTATESSAGNSRPKPKTGDPGDKADTPNPQERAVAALRAKFNNQ